MEKIPMTQIIDLVILFAGIYSLVICLQMKQKQVIHKNVLAPEEQKKCKDQKGFIATIFLPMLIFSIILIVSGGLGLVLAFLSITNRIVDYGVLLVFLLSFTFFASSLRKAREKFVNL